MSSPPPLKVTAPRLRTAAIIGISNYARQHLLIALEQMLQRQLHLVAATVVNQREEAVFCARLRRMGCEIFSDADAMWAAFAGRVDVCFIPTGIHLHAAMTIQALRAGASVLVEKPLAGSVAQAREIMSEERKTGRFVAVGFQDLYAESTWRIKQYILGGGLGSLHSATLVGMWPRTAAYYARNAWAGRLSFNGQPVMDSPVSNAFGHFFNLTLFWAGAELAGSASVRRVECELYRAQPIESFDTCCGRAVLSGGCELRFYLSHSCRDERKPQLVLEGTEGSITWVQESHYEVTGRDGIPQRFPVPGKLENKFMMADAVVARMDGGSAQICSTAIALEHVKLIEAIHAASPIVDIPAGLIRRGVAAGNSHLEIDGIDAIIDEANRRRQLWSEIGVPWARPPQPYEVRPAPADRIA